MLKPPTTPTPSPRASVYGLLFALVFPSIVTLAYFVLLSDMPAAVQQGAYVAGKTIQFSFPLLFAAWILREPIRTARFSTAGVYEGAFSGLMILIFMLLLYFALLLPSELFTGVGAQVRAKVDGLGINTPLRYLALGIFYSLFHSLLEEYYWRWFVFGQLRRNTSFAAATAISSIGFMAHHVILLGVYFGWRSPATYLFSAAIAIGGAYWAWAYERSGSLYGPWLSHLLVDAAIFTIGYSLL